MICARPIGVPDALAATFAAVVAIALSCATGACVRAAQLDPTAIDAGEGADGQLPDAAMFPPDGSAPDGDVIPSGPDAMVLPDAGLPDAF